MFFLVFAILIVLIAPLAIRLAGVLLILWVCVQFAHYWWIVLPLVILCALGYANRPKARA